MDELVEFLRAQIDEDEAVAKAALVEWDAEWNRDDAWIGTDDEGGWEDVAGPFVTRSGEIASLDHAARHDPARALREVEAKRRILNAYEESKAEAEKLVSQRAHGAVVMAATAVVGAMYLVLQEHAAIHSDHPDYRPEWKPQ